MIFMEGISLSQETVLRVALDHCQFDLDPEILYFHIGDLVNVNTTGGNIRGRLRRVDDNEIELDVSKEFHSELKHIPFNRIARIVKEGNGYGR
jgi:hypothetical protein